MSLSPDDFVALQAQLLALRTEVYTLKDRDTKNTRLRSEDDAKMKGMEAALAKAHAYHASLPPPSSSSASEGLSSMFSSVKRNSVAMLAGGGSPSPTLKSQPSPTVAIAPISESAAIASLRASHAADLDDINQQTIVQKQSIQHLHKKTIDLERQNATLMTHISEFAEERHATAERKEKMIKRRQLRVAAAAAIDGDRSAAASDDSDEDDIDVARLKWSTLRSSLESQVAMLQSDLATASTALTASRAECSVKDEFALGQSLKLAEERRNFDRILEKLSNKEMEISGLRDELTKQNKFVQGMRQQNMASPPAAAASTTNASNGAPSKPSSSFKNFLSAIKKDITTATANVGMPSSPNPATTIASPPISAHHSRHSDDISIRQSSGPTLMSAIDSASTSSSSDGSTDSSSSSHHLSVIPPSPPTSRSGSSASPSTAARLASLESDLESLRSMNDHLIASVQKKDGMMSAMRDDGDRIMQKLMEKETQIMTLREAAANVGDIANSSKKKDTLIAKLEAQLVAASNLASSVAATAASNRHSSAAETKQSATLTLELTAAASAISMMQHEFDNLKSSLEDTKDMLFLAETNLIDRQKQVTSQTDDIRDLRNSGNTQSATILALLAQKLKIETDMNEHCDYLERKCISEVEEWERKYDVDRLESSNDMAALQSKLDGIQSELTQMQHELSSSELRQRELQSTCDALTAVDSARTASHTDMDNRLTSLLANGAIETRKRNTLVIELKCALKSELIRFKEVEAKLRMAEDDIVTLRVLNREQIATNVNSTRTADAEGGDNNSGNDSTANATGDASFNNGTTTAPSQSPPVHSRGVEQEVTAALASKLAELQSSHHSLLNVKRRLEDHIELLETDVSQKRDMIRNLVRRIESGALSATPQESAQKQALFGSLTVDARQALFDKMEIILQETTLQNDQYKSNLQSMGNEVTKLMQELDDKSSDLTSVRDDLDTNRDELDLAQQSITDSLAMLKTSDDYAKKIESGLKEVMMQIRRTTGGGEEGINNIIDGVTTEEVKAILRRVMMSASSSNASSPARSTTAAVVTD